MTWVLTVVFDRICSGPVNPRTAQPAVSARHALDPKLFYDLEYGHVFVTSKAPHHVSDLRVIPPPPLSDVPTVHHHSYVIG